MGRFCRILVSVVAGCLFACSGIRAQENAPQAAPVPDKQTPDQTEPEKQSEVLPAAVTLNAKIQKEYQGISNPPHRLDNVARVGEKLTYAVKWGFAPAGKATLRVKRKVSIRGRNAFAFEMQAQSNDFLHYIYPVDSTVSSVADIETGMSYLFKRDLREGRRQVDDRLEFDVTHKDAAGLVEPVALYSKVKGDTTERATPRPIPGPVQDSLSVVYYMRHLAFENIGDKHQVLVGSRKRVDVVTIEAKRFSRLDLGRLGSFDCIVVEPTGDKEAERSTLIAAEGSAEIWLEKNTRIPLMIVVDVPIGSIRVSLIQVENADLDKYDVKKNPPAGEEEAPEGVQAPKPEDF